MRSTEPGGREATSHYGGTRRSTEPGGREATSHYGGTRRSTEPGKQTAMVEQTQRFTKTIYSSREQNAKHEDWSVKQRKLEGKIMDNIKQDPKCLYKYARSQLKVLYKYARSQLKVKVMVRPFEDEHGNIVINDNLKTATTFNNHFTTQFTQENLEIKMFQGCNEEELNSITFEESSICNKLKKLNVFKSPGTDKIFSVVLNRCAEELAKPLNALFTKSFQSGQVP